MTDADKEEETREAEDDGDEKTTKNNAVVPSLTMSKAWGEKTAHSTSYNGGKVVMCRGAGAKHLYGYGQVHGDENESQEINNDKDNHDNATKSPRRSTAKNTKNEEHEERTPFLAAMCNGDVALIDAKRGVKVRTLRVGLTLSAGAEVAHINDVEEDFEQMDPDDIATFALSYNDNDIITASKNTVLRHYDISGSSGNDNNSKRISYSGENGTGPAIVQRMFGKSHRLPVKCIEFHKSGIFFATGSVDGSAKVWDMRGGFATHVFKPKSRSSGLGGISSLRWSHQQASLILAAATESGSISIYDLKDSSTKKTIELNEHVSTVTNMRWTADSEFFVSSGRDAVINVWKVGEEDITTTINRPRKKSKKSKEKQTKNDLYRQNYQHLFAQPLYEQIEGMELIEERNNLMYGDPSPEVTLATAGEKGIVRLWKSKRMESIEQGGGPMLSKFESLNSEATRKNKDEAVRPYSSLFKSNNDREIVAVNIDHIMTFLDIDHLDVQHTIVGHNDEILDLCIIPSRSHSSPLGDDEDDHSIDNNKSTHQKIAVATNTSHVSIFDLSTFSCQNLHGHKDTVLALDVSPCGRLLVTAGKDNTMRLWDLEHLRCIGVARGHTEGIGATALSRKVGKYDVSGKASESGAGAFAVTASKDRTLKKWRLPSVTELVKEGAGSIELHALESVRAHEKDINIVSVAPNDSLIATGSQDKTVKIWNASDLSLKRTLRGHKRGVWDCQFSPFDRIIATASADATIRLWSLATNDCLRTFQGHTASVLRVRFLTAGLQLLSSGADGLVKLWTVKSNECEATMDGHTDKVWAMDFISDENVLVSGGADSRIVVWNDITAEEEAKRQEVEENELLIEQRLSNHIRFKEYKQALELALETDRPNQALKVLLNLIENEQTNGRDPLLLLQQHVKHWSMDRVTHVLRYCREWNVRARNCFVAMLIVKAIFTVIPVSTLVSSSTTNSTSNEIPELMACMMPYAERHFNRLDKLYGNSYLLDFTLFSMGTLLPGEDEDSNRNKKTISSWEERFENTFTTSSNNGTSQTKPSSSEQLNQSKEQTMEVEELNSEVETVGESDSDSDDGSSSSDS